MRAFILLSILSFVSSLSFARGGSGTVGPGNPSAFHCEAIGGKLQDIVDDKGNQSSLCAVGAASVESWTLYRKLNLNIEQMALTVLMTHPEGPSVDSKNPTADYCLQVAGQLEIAKSEDGEVSVCTFSDNSSIETGTLYRGPKSKFNQKLVQLLKKQGDLK